ncbi:CD166 antigen isoform X2 [Salvelinus alpinus]|uniref:CD166 antigen isoform X2 n=1 Tax=Salvelinus alpinus TaxID=8036 RepID=UPI0039FC99BB
MAKRLLLDYHKSLPLNGLQASTVLLLIYGFTCVCSNEVLVPERVSAVLGKNITLGCRVEVGTNLSLTQSSWERRLPSGTITLAVFNPQFGISISPDYARRLSFLNPSVHDATIVLEGVGFQDIGSYTCKVATFPLGNTQASTTVNILVEPKVYVSAGSTALVDGGNESVAATCIAERGRPAAEVSWETELFGRSEVQTQDEPNGTSTTQVRYVLEPRRHSQGHTLTCVVRHPALQTEFRIPYVLNVQFAPEVTVVGYDQNWFVGQDNVKLDCGAKANPPAHHFSWTRLDGPMPDGVDIVNNTFTFTRPLERNDSGLYRCEVSNDIGPRGQDVHVWIQDMEEDMEIDRNVTGILGEDVFLRCQYLGQNDITDASWKRPDSRMKQSMKKLTGYKNNKTFSKDPDFSAPASPTNLTVKMRVSTLEAQGEYTCVFATDEEEITNSMFLTVLARPDIYTVVTEDTDNATHYQSVTCSATNGKPMALIRWEINGSPPTNDSSVGMRNTSYTNGTATMTSFLRFPTHLQDQDRVTCVVQHPTLPDPTTHVTVRVETFESPVMHVFVVRQRESPLWLAVCEYRGGRFGAHLSWVLPDNATGHISFRSGYEGVRVLTNLTYEFSLALHEGQDLICLIQNRHGLKERRTVHVPKYYISSVRVLNQTTPLYKPYGDEFVIHRMSLKENFHNQRILLKVYGSVPTYSLTCQRNDGTLVQMDGRALLFQSEVTEREAGLYTCQASFYHHQASVLIQVEVTSEDKQLSECTLTLSCISETTILIVFIVCLSSAAAITILLVTLCVFCKINGDCLASKLESLAPLTSLTQELCSPELRKGKTVTVPGGGGQEYNQLLSDSIVIDARSTV